MKRILLALVMMCGSAFSQVSMDWQISLSEELNLGTFPQCTSGVERFHNIFAQTLPSGDLILRMGVYDYSLYFNGITSSADQENVFKTCLEGIITQSGEASSFSNFFIGDDDVGDMPLHHFLTFKNSARLFVNQELVSSNNYERLKNVKVDYINSTGEYENSTITKPDSIDGQNWFISRGDHSHLNHFYTVGLYSYQVEAVRDDGNLMGFKCPTNLIVTKYSITSNSESYPENGNIISTYTSSGFNQDNFVLNWDTLSGTEYQIQSSTDLTNWVNVGSAIVGTGETMMWANHITNSQAFYRVVED